MPKLVTVAGAKDEPKLPETAMELSDSVLLAVGSTVQLGLVKSSFTGESSDCIAVNDSVCQRF